MGNSVGSGTSAQRDDVYKVVVVFLLKDRQRHEFEFILGQQPEQWVLEDINLLLGEMQRGDSELASVTFNALKRNKQRDRTPAQMNLWTSANMEKLPIDRRRLQRLTESIKQQSLARLNSPSGRLTRPYDAAIYYHIVNQGYETDTILARALFTVFAINNVLLVDEANIDYGSYRSEVLLLLGLQRSAYLFVGSERLSFDAHLVRAEQEQEQRQQQRQPKRKQQEQQQQQQQQPVDVAEDPDNPYFDDIDFSKRHVSRGYRPPTPPPQY